MKSSGVSKVIPGIVLAICACLLAFWFAYANRVGKAFERVPGTDRQPASTQATSEPPPGESVQAPSAPAATPPAGQSSVSTDAQAPAIAGAWPRFRGANFDNISTENTPLARTWRAGQPRILWSLDMGEGHAGAAVLNGRAYVLDYDRQGQADVLRCLSLADGRELWHYSYPVSVKRNHGMSRTVPAVTDKFVVTIGPKLHVLCADALTGKPYWMIDLVKDYGATVPPWYAGQCPIIDGDRAIIAPGGSTLMIAVDCATGRVLWRTPNPKRWAMTHSSIVPVSMGSLKTYVYCASGGVVGVSATDGRMLWELPDWKVQIANIPTPVPVGQGRLFLSGGYNAGSMMADVTSQGGAFRVKEVYRLKPETFGSHQQTPMFYRGRIFGVIPDGRLVCMGLDGKHIWDSGTARFGLGPYVVADGKLYVLSDQGVLTIVDPNASKYTPLGQARILGGSDAWAPLAVAGGRMIARDLTKMVCIDLTGK